MRYQMILLSLLCAGCAGAGLAPEFSAAQIASEAEALIARDFQSKGAASRERLLQRDAAQKQCSGATLEGAAAAELEAQQLATVRYPADGKWLGDWKKGEAIAQNGRGMQSSDAAGGVNGGNCYACHQINKKEISFGNLGPSLSQYGKLRGGSEEVLRYTWAKIYNAQAYRACSVMPRFGHQGILTEEQIRDVMALLLDPASPVNQ
ncbi:sulfur oxidation c-type cytochrome SoxX [Massilia sp. W12]|uniref:sulfur oxidation c-type cytochrome SoxX n=1 Tax=Massilia sp. W12 TaxID=3126507 RepID=UPI0030D4059F